MRPTVHPITLRDGPQLEYAQQGPPDGVPLLLLHGYTDSWRSFEPLMAALPNSLRVYALSQRGHGDSDRPASGYGTRDYANDAARFIDAMDVGPMFVLGHSMGSANALMLAIDHPRLVRGLVLVGAFAGFATNQGLQDFHRDAIAPLQDPVPRTFVEQFQRSTIAQPVSDAFFDMVVDESLKVPARVWRATFARLFDDAFVEGLGRIDTPTLILWGVLDAMASRSDQLQLLRSITGSQFSVFPGTGHAPHWEHAEALARELHAFTRHHAGPAQANATKKPVDLVAAANVSDTPIRFTSTSHLSTTE